MVGDSGRWGRVGEKMMKSEDGEGKREGEKVGMTVSKQPGVWRPWVKGHGGPQKGEEGAVGTRDMEHRVLAPPGTCCRAKSAASTA